MGILSEPFTTLENTTEFMIAASYVKWLEASGARSIPIPYDATQGQVDDIFAQIDGVLFPGGSGRFLPPAANHIWRLAQAENSKDGGFFPIWGTCMGFEYLLMLASGKDDILEGGFDAENISLPLQLLRHQSSTNNSSLLYRGMERLVQTNNITLNNHHFGITPHRFRRNTELTSMFDITSTNQDRQGRHFVSTIEPKDPNSNPYYGVQYHPEKNAFEYATYPGTDISYEAIDHSPEGLLLTTHLGRFFVNLTRVVVIVVVVNNAAAAQLRHRPTATSYHPHPVYTYPRRVGVKFQEYYLIPSAADMFSEKQVAYNSLVR